MTQKEKGYDYPCSYQLYQSNITEENFCDICGNYQSHYPSAFNERSHLTCICFIIEHKAICCTEGFVKLLEEVPALATSLPLPDKFGYQLFKGIRSGLSEVIVSQSTYSEIQEVCAKSFLKAIEIFFAKKKLFTTIKDYSYY